jgi:hypothetical protein
MAFSGKRKSFSIRPVMFSFSLRYLWVPAALREIALSITQDLRILRLSTLGRLSYHPLRFLDRPGTANADSVEISGKLNEPTQKEQGTI